MRKMVVNLCLLLMSCAAGVALCEISLRLFYPKYRHLTDAQFQRDARRFYARKPNARSWASHPDTGSLHLFHHNNLALRQHRNFTEADLASATNIGVFGDSFVENIGMAAMYSFTEPLDYLLNQSGKPFNVLNFGVIRYGLGQSFLTYEDFRHAADLDHVLYVYCKNDLGELYGHGLFDLDDAGRLVENRAIPVSGWVRLISQLHLSYLLLDGSGRFSSFIGERATSGKGPRTSGSASRTENILPPSGRNKEKYKQAVFRQVIRRWKHLVEHNGSTFSVVLLPNDSPQPFVVDLLNAEGVEVIDLSGCFGNADPAHNRRMWTQSPYRFKNDWHWNEAGNRLAAVCLYRVFEEKYGVRIQTDEDLQATLYGYYAAFEGWMPPTPRIPVSEQTATGIREKYNQLDTLASTREQIRELTPHRARVLASDFDVYLDGRRLVYIKEGCRPTDLQPLIFLHLVPVDENDLPRRRIPYGYVRATFSLRFGIDRGRCLATTDLPDYPVRYLWTGEYSQDGDLLWQGGFPVDPDISSVGGGGSYGRSDTPIIASDFDVYLDGRYLVYVNEECFASDPEAWFFLHIIPVDKDALPPDRMQYGFDNLDFHYSGSVSRELGCRIMRRLPDYAIRHIRTGQFVKDTQGDYLVLWEGEFSVDQSGRRR